jgi:hypothetical protein
MVSLLRYARTTPDVRKLFGWKGRYLGWRFLQPSGKVRLVLLCGLLNSVNSILPDDNYHAI